MKVNLIKIFVLSVILMLVCIKGSTYAQEKSNKAKEYGWVKIHTNLEKFYIVIDNDYRNSYLITSGDSLKLPIYGHELRIVWRNIDDHITLVDIPPNKTVTKRINFTRFPNEPKSSHHILVNKQNVSITSDQNSEIFIDGKSEGTQYVELYLNPGIYDLVIENPEFGSLKKSLKIEHSKYTSIARYNENPNPISPFLKLLPGASYVSTKQSKKAVATYTGLVLLTGTVLYFNSEYNSKNDLFQKQNEAYLAATFSQEAIIRREIAQSTLNEMDALSKKITFATISALTIYAITTIDGFRKPNDGYKGPNFYTPQFGVNVNPIDGNVFAEISFQKRF